MTTHRTLILILILSTLTLMLTLLHHRAHPHSQASPRPSPSDPRPALSDADIQRIAQAIQAALPAPPPVRLADQPVAGDHPLKASFQRGIRKLQADIRRRSDQALTASDPPPRTSSSPADTATSAGWQVLSSTSRTSAALVQTLLAADATALTAACALTTPLTVRFAYRWVRAQYASDDHGLLAATVTTGATDAQRPCVLKHLARAQVVGQQSHGKSAWTLEARFTPSQEASP